MALTSSEHRNRQDLMNTADQVFKDMERDGVKFELEVGWAKNYDDLFRNEIQRSSESEILARVLSVGRGIIVGRGGSGKTFLMRRVARQALKQGVLPILLDLKDWKKADYQAWNRWAERPGGGADFLIERFSRPKTSFLELDYLPPTAQKILLVDGLNEIAERTGQEALLALDEFARTQIQASVLVTDRLTRRHLPFPSKWTLGKVLPISKERIKKYGAARFLNGPLAPMLELPYFLDTVLKNPKDKSLSSSRTHEEFLASHAGLTGDDLKTASAAAFTVYKEGMTRSFSLADFEQTAGAHVVSKLVAAGILEKNQGSAQFAHHLLHDYLAARHMASFEPSQWNQENLDAISFNASSFDTIVLILERLSSDRADIFLRHVYDWNLYATGYALTERNPSHVGPSAEMEIVIFSMLAEKKFDRILATAQRAGDALLVSNSEHVAPFRNAQSMNDVFAATKSIQTSAGWFLEWRDIFTREPGQPASVADVTQIQVGDSVLGWTWANVLRRLELNEPQLVLLREMLQEPSPTVKWRVVHVLGAFPSELSMASLISALQPNIELNVRYGAVRSLAEMASRADDELRRRLFAQLESNLEVLTKDEKVLSELKRALMIRPGVEPVGWIKMVLALAREFYKSADDPKNKDQWIAYVGEVEALYDGQV